MKTTLQPSLQPTLQPDSPLKPKTSNLSVVWNPWLAVLFVVVTYYASQLLGGLAVSIYPALQHWSNTQTTDWLNNSVLAQFFYIVIAETLSVGSLWLFLRKNKISLSQIGLRRPKWSDAGWGIAVFPIYLVTYLGLQALIAAFVPAINVDQPQQLGFSDVHGFGPLAVTFISLVILPPIAEEIIVRGYLFSSLKRHLPKVGAALLTSVIFASAHLQAGSGAPLLWIAGIDTFVLSLFLLYLREMTGGLYANMTLHALKNLLAFAALFIWHAK